jgi:hypothetical protein
MRVVRFPLLFLLVGAMVALRALCYLPVALGSLLTRLLLTLTSPLFAVATFTTREIGRAGYRAAGIK